MNEMGSSGDVLLRYCDDGRVEAIGRTHLNPVDYILCEGNETEVLRILVSIYGTTMGARCGRPSRLRIDREYIHGST